MMTYSDLYKEAKEIVQHKMYPTMSASELEELVSTVSFLITPSDRKSVFSILFGGEIAVEFADRDNMPYTLCTVTIAQYRIAEALYNDLLNDKLFD